MKKTIINIKTEKSLEQLQIEHIVAKGQIFIMQQVMALPTKAVKIRYQSLSIGGKEDHLQRVTLNS